MTHKKTESLEAKSCEIIKRVAFLTFVDHLDGTTVVQDVEAIFEVQSSEFLVNSAKLVVRKVMYASVDCSKFFRSILGDINHMWFSG